MVPGVMVLTATMLHCIATKWVTPQVKLTPMCLIGVASKSQEKAFLQCLLKVNGLVVTFHSDQGLYFTL